MNKFVIPIPNERARTYRLINLIILVLNFFVFGVVFMKAGVKSLDFVAIAGLVVNGIPAIYFILNKKHLRTPLVQVSFSLDALFWIAAGSWSLFFLMLFLALLSIAANRPLQIIVDESGITYPAFMSKKYSWSEVERVILKDDILTIDLKNNKLMQVALESESAEDFDEKRFNEVAAVRLKLAQSIPND